MWKNIVNTEFFLIYENGFVFVTNYTKIWFINFSEESFLSCLKHSNMGLEMADSQLVQKGKQILSAPEKLKSVSHKEEDNSLVLSLTMSFGYPIKLKIKMLEGSKELFFRKVTQCLLRTVQDLRSSQRELRDELHKKDLEIEEYKCEGGEIALRFLKTVPFDDARHVSRHGAYGALFGEGELPAWLLDKEVAAPEDRPVKTEPTSVQEQSIGGAGGAAPEDGAVKAEPIHTMKEESLEGLQSLPVELPDGGGAQAAGDGQAVGDGQSVGDGQAGGGHSSQSPPRPRPATAARKRKKLNL